MLFRIVASKRGIKYIIRSNTTYLRNRLHYKNDVTMIYLFFTDKEGNRIVKDQMKSLKFLVDGSEYENNYQELINGVYNIPLNSPINFSKINIAEFNMELSPDNDDQYFYVFGMTKNLFRISAGLSGLAFGS